MGEWVEMLWSVHAVRCHSLQQRKVLLVPAATCMDL